jgi:hypothetical protein
VFTPPEEFTKADVKPKFQPRHKVIVALTVPEILDEQMAKKLV